MQKLLFLQSLWSMINLRSGPDRSLADNVARIAEAGFDGIGALWDTRDNARAAADAARDHGLRLVGPLPADVQNYTSYTAAVMNGAGSSGAAQEFVRYLGTPGAKALFTAAGIE